jgi:hypothetical protein
MENIKNYKTEALQLLGALIGGLAIAAASYYIRTGIQPLVQTSADQINSIAEPVLLILLLALAALFFFTKRYGALIGIVLSYPVFYFILFLLLGIACSQGTCL